MPSERGAANLAKFNEERSKPLLEKLKNELKMCRKSKLEFKTYGLLASYLSERLNIHRTTFKRNPEYNALLLTYIAGLPGVVSRTPDTTQDPSVLQAKLSVSKLEASLQREQLLLAAAKIERLKTSQRAPSSVIGEVAFSDLAAVMAAILLRFPDFLHLDFEKRELIDLSARPSERLIASSDRIGKFCVWVEQNQSLPHLQRLKQLK